MKILFGILLKRKNSIKLNEKEVIDSKRNSLFEE